MDQDFISDLEFEFSLKLSDIESLSHLVLEFHGQALYWDENADEKVISVLKGHRIDLTLAREQYDNIQDLFDTISPEISDLGQHIVNNNDCYVECFSRDEKEETPCGGLVYIDELVVAQGFRSRGLGTEMLKRMSEVVDLNKTLVALKAVPIIDEAVEKRTPELKKRLKNFYCKLGFRHSGEHYMVKDARDCYAQRKRALAESGIGQTGLQDHFQSIPLR
jgi:GNAT superfamily N-acetyltransferase